MSEVERKEFTDECGEKCSSPQAQLLLKDPGRFSINRLVVKLSGQQALHPFRKGDLVAVSLSFSVRDRGDGPVNEIAVNDIRLVKDLYQ